MYAVVRRESHVAAMHGKWPGTIRCDLCRWGKVREKLASGMEYAVERERKEKEKRRKK